MGAHTFQRDLEDYLNARNDSGIRGLDIGDSGGFSGVAFDASNTALDLYIDGSALASISAGDGGGAIDIGDAGGFSGFKWNATDTTVEVYIDGTLTHSFETDGSITDEVA